MSKEVKITVVTYEQYTDYEFVDPATFYVMTGLQEYYYFHTSSRSVAQQKANELFGENKYTVKASKIQKTKSRQENGGVSVRGKQFTKGQKR